MEKNGGIFFTARSGSAENQNTTMTLEEAGKELGYTREETRRIEANIMEDRHLELVHTF